MTAPTQTATPTIIAFDLDRTLLYSNSSAGDPSELPPLRLVENYQGKPLSRMTETAWTLLDDLMGQALVVPVTTRTQEQYNRVMLPRTPAYAICGNGGVLLRDGQRDSAWDAWAQDVADWSAPLVHLTGMLDAVNDQPWVVMSRSAEDLFCYLVARDRASIPLDWLDNFSRAAADAGWTVSVQGRKVYAVPSGLGKHSALVRLRDQLAMELGQVPRVLAAGDSLLDAPMLLAADAAIRPAHGELHEQAWTPPAWLEPDVTVTSASGALAGEEIVRWMLGQVSVSQPVTVQNGQS